MIHTLGQTRRAASTRAEKAKQKALLKLERNAEGLGRARNGWQRDGHKITESALVAHGALWSGEKTDQVNPSTLSSALWRVEHRSKVYETTACG